MKEKETTVEANVNEQQNVAKKRTKRGISNDTRSTSRLKFDDRRDSNNANGLFIGHLDSIEITWATIGAEVTTIPSFAGLAVPILHINFCSNEEQENVRKYVTHRIMPVESNVLTIPGGDDAWKINAALSWMKHIMDIFLLKGRQMTEEEEDALCLSYEDFDEDGNYIPVEAEDVINSWRVLFENFIKIMDNNGKPVYKTATGGIISVWMKLLRFTKNKNVWSPVVRGKTTMGDLGFPTFVGEGLIEIYKNQVAPLIKIDTAKETIRYKEIVKAAPAAPAGMGNNMMGGAIPNMGGMPTPDMGGAPSQFGATSFPGGNPADDLPF